MAKDHSTVAPMVLKNLRDEIDTVMKLDPAARSRLEVVLCYPGFHALLFYRLAHWLWERRWLVLGRFISYLGRMLTGSRSIPAPRSAGGSSSTMASAWSSARPRRSATT